MYTLRRVSDYGEWFAGFIAALEQLEPRLQAASSLPIIYQWEQPLSQTPDLKCAPLAACTSAVLKCKTAQSVCLPLLR